MDRHDERDRGWRAHHDGDLSGPYARDTRNDFGGEHARERGFRGRGPKNYRRPDERIAEDIHLMLTDDPDIDAYDIEVHVENGEVTLNGIVRSRWEKRAAEDLVAQCTGVHDVHNRLKVQPYEQMHIGKAQT